MSETERKRPKPYRRRGYGILNPYGDIWTHNFFETPGAARVYLEDFWRGTEVSTEGFRVVKVEQRTSYVGEDSHP